MDCFASMLGWYCWDCCKVTDIERDKMWPLTDEMYRQLSEVVVHDKEAADWRWTIF